MATDWEADLRAGNGYVVVTGGTGFLGAAVTRALTARGILVTVIDRNKGDNPAVNYKEDDCTSAESADIIAGSRGVFHFAGALGSEELDFDCQRGVQVNIAATVSVLDSAARNKVHVVLACKPNIYRNAYTITKRAAEEFALLYAQHGRCPVTCIKFFDVYGPGQRLYPVRKLVPNLFLRCLTGQPIELYGDGEQRCDFIYINDAAELAVRAYLAGVVGSFECGTGRTVRVAQMANFVRLATNSHASIRYVPGRLGETYDELRAHNDSLLKAIGPYEFTTPVDGLLWCARHYQSDAMKEEIAAADRFFRDKKKDQTP